MISAELRPELCRYRLVIDRRRGREGGRDGIYTLIPKSRLNEPKIKQLFDDLLIWPLDDELDGNMFFKDDAKDYV